MSVVPEHFKLRLTPAAVAEAVVQTGNARFTVLTDRMIRLEYHADGVFEDHASQAFWYRQQPVPPFKAHVGDGQVEIETEYLRLSYQGDGAFSPDNLSIVLKASGVVWHPGDLPADNLLGTTRTLDDKNGYTPLTLGLMSRAGWSVVDDSATLVLNDEGWLQNRTTSGIDWYFFGYGHDYKTCLRDYCRVSGEVPMIPRWVLGNWWSRYWEYTQDDFKQLIGDFQKYELPFSVCIIDMDWHVTQTGNASTGWTGYSWNRKLFPDPAGLDRLHARQRAENLAQSAPGGRHSRSRGQLYRNGAALGTSTRRPKRRSPSRSPILTSPTPISTFCTTPPKRWASISGGWTGSRG